MKTLTPEELAQAKIQALKFLPSHSATLRPLAKNLKPERALPPGVYAQSGPNPFRVQLVIDGVNTHFGSFANLKDAADAADTNRQSKKLIRSYKFPEPNHQDQ